MEMLDRMAESRSVFLIKVFATFCTSSIVISLSNLYQDRQSSPISSGGFRQFGVHVWGSLEMLEPEGSKKPDTICRLAGPVGSVIMYRFNVPGNHLQNKARLYLFIYHLCFKPIATLNPNPKS